MDKTEQSLEKFLNGYACSQAVVSTYASRYGLGEKEALKISSGFSGGMRMAGTCGAVTGAYMIIGLYAAGEHCEAVDDRVEVYNLINRFSKEFKNRNGCLNCCDLLACDISKPEGLESAKAQNLFKEKCPKFVKDASEILEDIID